MYKYLFILTFFVANKAFCQKQKSQKHFLLQKDTLYYGEINHIYLLRLNKNKETDTTSYYITVSDGDTVKYYKNWYYVYNLKDSVVTVKAFEEATGKLVDTKQMIVTQTQFAKQWKKVIDKPEITLDGFKGDSITVEQTKTIKKVILTEGFEFVSGDLIPMPENKEGWIVELNVFPLNAENFEKEILRFIRNASVGYKITISDIKVKNKEGKIIEMPYVSYKIIK